MNARRGGGSLDLQGFDVSRAALLLTVAPAVMLGAYAVADEVHPPPQTFQAHELHVKAWIGKLSVEVSPDAHDIVISLSGDENAIQNVQLSAEGDTAVIRMQGLEGDWWDTMWDWSEYDPDDLEARVIVPSGTPVQIDGLAGDATIGDLLAPIGLKVAAGDVTIGRVTDAAISIAGSAGITVAHADQSLRVEIAGSGDVTCGDASSARIEIAGGGEVHLGHIAKSLDVQIAGSGDVSAESVHGSVMINVAGSGEVDINGGVADPFHVDIAGSGDVRFAGTANNPVISVMGSGDVWLAAYTGALKSDGADIKIGPE
jgi:hypothetical protein